jgi:hypothetical protein
MNEQLVVGLKPSLPGFLGRSSWWTEPIAAERLAAVRIGTAAVLLADIWWTYLPQATDFYGGGSLGSPEVFAGRLSHSFRWSLLAGVSDQRIVLTYFAVWAAAAICLLFGIFPRLAACAAWALAVSFQNANAYIHNSGDMVRQILLFYLMIAPCGAAWSLASFRRSRLGDHRPAFIHPWPIRLLLVQLVAIYFINGTYKIAGEDWRGGDIMHRVLANVLWTRFSYDQLPHIPGTVAVMTWVTLIWELGFPILIATPRLRAPALWLGVLFHLTSAALLTLAPFPFYMLCLYLPFVPWESRCGLLGRTSELLKAVDAAQGPARQAGPT